MFPSNRDHISSDGRRTVLDRAAATLIGRCGGTIASLTRASGAAATGHGSG
jgi:hypothetical protein